MTRMTASSFLHLKPWVVKPDLKAGAEAPARFAKIALSTEARSNSKGDTRIGCPKNPSAE